MGLTGLRVLGLTLIHLMVLNGLLVAIADAQGGECGLGVAAVSSSGEGVMGSLTVKVKPGSGLIFVSVNPAVEVDVQGAARIAVLAASIVGGFNPLAYDYYFMLDSPAIIVGGPSAGAAMALAVLLAVKGLECGGDYVVTGMINPDTTIGPVGGLKEKLEAAAASGAKTFIVPLGQSKYTYYERVLVRRGPFTFITVRPETVDLKSYGRELGVTVVEVRSLSDLYSMVTGERIAYANGSLGDISGLREVAARVLGEAESLLEALRGYNVRGGIVEDAVSELNSARDLLGRGGSSYAILLKGVRAASLAQVAVWSVRGFDVDVVYANVSRELEEFNTIYESMESSDLGVLEVKGLAFLHAWRAGMLLDTTYSNIKGRGFATLEEALSIARSMWEVRVAKLILAGVKPSNVTVNVSSLRVVSSYLVATAKGVIAYSTQVFSEANIGSPPDEAIRMAVSASLTKDPMAALLLASRSMAIVTSAIHSSFTSGADTFDEIARLALNLALKSNSTLAQTLLRASLDLRDYQLLTESILVSWATITMRGPETPQIEEIPQPHMITAPISKIGNGTQYSRVQRVLQTILEASIWTLAIATILLALLTITTFIVYRKVRGGTPT
jgi:uncharacterized protein